MSVGLEHVCLWSVSPAQTLTGNKAKLPASKPGQRLGFPSVAFTRSGTALLAASDGSVYSFNGTAPGKLYKGAHTKMVSCISCVAHPSDPSLEVVVTGGADKVIHVSLLDARKAMTRILTFEVAATPRSVDSMGDCVLAGLANGSILELSNALSNPAAVHCEVLIRSHYDGEAWGLALAEEQDRCVYFTSGDDNQILMFDA